MNRTGRPLRARSARGGWLKVLGIASALALGVGALLVFAGESSRRASMTPSYEEAPAVAPPSRDQATNTTPEPASTPAAALAADTTCNDNPPAPAVTNNPNAGLQGYPDMQTVDPVFYETHHPEERGDDSAVDTTSAAPDTPSGSDYRNPYRGE